MGQFSHRQKGLGKFWKWKGGNEGKEKIRDDRGKEREKRQENRESEREEKEKRNGKGRKF